MVPVSSFGQVFACALLGSFVLDFVYAKNTIDDDETLGTNKFVETHELNEIKATTERHVFKTEEMVLSDQNVQQSIKTKESSGGTCVNKWLKFFQTIIKSRSQQEDLCEVFHEITASVPESRVKVDFHESNDIADIDGKPKQKVVPLLYTFRTLLSSFLAEFTVDHSVDGSTNSSKLGNGNSTAAEIMENVNSTGNGTDSGKKTRFQCAPRNTSENETYTVKIVNSTELLEMLNFSKTRQSSACVLVLFYAPWCPFCAQMAPQYNALARVFPQLDVLAVDTSHFSYLNARFGTVAVPNIMLFHARSAVRFNQSSRVLENFVEFVTNNTGLEGVGSMNVTSDDLQGPLPPTVEPTTDWLLWAAWAFVLVCVLQDVLRSQAFHGALHRVHVLWQEHQHQE